MINILAFVSGVVGGAIVAVVVLFLWILRGGSSGYP